VALKAHQAWEAAEHMRPLLGPDTAVVTAQNGVPWWYFHGLDKAYAGLRLRSVDPGDRQWKAIGPHRVIGCTVYPATEIASPGAIRHIYGDTFGFGEPNRQPSARLEKLAEAFRRGGLKPRIYDDIRDDIWIKLWGNLCFNPISAITQATLDIIATDPGTPRARAQDDAGGAADRPSFRRALPRRRRQAHQRRRRRRRAPHLHAPGPRDKGRQLEIDALLTAVQEMGRLAGIDTPFIDAVLALVQQLGRVRAIYPTSPKTLRRSRGRRDRPRWPRTPRVTTQHC
jgi:2-dehydropantoate 2-reductase